MQNVAILRLSPNYPHAARPTMGMKRRSKQQLSSRGRGNVRNQARISLKTMVAIRIRVYSTTPAAPLGGVALTSPASRRVDDAYPNYSAHRTAVKNRESDRGWKLGRIAVSLLCAGWLAKNTKVAQVRPYWISLSLRFTRGALRPISPVPLNYYFSCCVAIAQHPHCSSLCRDLVFSDVHLSCHSRYQMMAGSCSP